MTRRTLRLFTLVLVAAAAFAACEGDTEVDAPNEVTGVVVDIESAGIGDIRGFRLKDGDNTYDVVIDPDAEYGFDLGHLQEHLSGSLPIKVELERRDGVLYAETIEDA